MSLTEKNLALLGDEQKTIVLTQFERHQHEDHEVDYDVSGDGDKLERFLLKKGVWNPFLASGRFHARYLFYHNSDYQDKEVIEIGSGTGLMGVVMAKYGARRVIMSDISPLAVENSRENAKRFGVDSKVEVVQGDLFENIREKADLITWMIPFFPGMAPEGDTISASMLMLPSLFRRFLIEAKDYLKEGGKLVLPSYTLGGNFTSPVYMGEQTGYKVKTTWTHTPANGIQKGLHHIHELTLEGKR